MGSKALLVFAAIFVFVAFVGVAFVYPRYRTLAKEPKLSASSGSKHFRIARFNGGDFRAYLNSHRYWEKGKRILVGSGTRRTLMAADIEVRLVDTPQYGATRAYNREDGELFMAISIGNEMSPNGMVFTIYIDPALVEATHTDWEIINRMVNEQLTFFIDTITSDAPNIAVSTQYRVSAKPIEFMYVLSQ